MATLVVGGHHVASAVHAVDDLHTSPDGVFFWDESLEKERYDENFKNFCQSCDSEIDFVFCDAINNLFKNIDLT